MCMFDHLAWAMAAAQMTQNRQSHSWRHGGAGMIHNLSEDEASLHLEVQ